MRIGPCTLLLALSFAPALLSQSTATQTAKPSARRIAAKSATASPAKPAATPVASTTPATPAACTCPSPTVAQRHYPPYAAKQTTTRVQTLANGTNITTVTTAQLWRDADGRTRTDSIRTFADGTQYHTVNINDPIGRVQMNWTVGMPNAAKVITIYHYPQPIVQTQPVVQPVTTVLPTAQRYYPTSNESLPPQTIDGLYVTGNRNTRTVPAGYEGNDRDMTTTSEIWYSQSLGLQLRSITDDPRTGKMTTEITDIQQTIPDPALFQPPEGYQIKETNQ